MRFAHQFDAIATVAYVFVAVCCISLAGVAAAGKKGASTSTVRRDPISRLGLLIQMAAYAICYLFPRPYFSPIVSMLKWQEGIVAGGAMLMALASTLFCYAAARALGKQWALVARVIEGHELIERGPYAVVRNPIYFAMFVGLIAAGITATRWPAFLAALLVFLLGTWVRIRSEESILRQAFGAQFDDYARRVPAFLPWLL